MTGRLLRPAMLAILKHPKAVSALPAAYHRPRQTVPPSMLKRPDMRLSAPTKALPWPAPINSFRGIAAMLIGTNGPARRDPRSKRAPQFLARATLASDQNRQMVPTTRAIALKMSCIGRDLPTSGPPPRHRAVPVWKGATGRCCQRRARWLNKAPQFEQLRQIFENACLLRLDCCQQGRARTHDDHRHIGPVLLDP